MKKTITALFCTIGVLAMGSAAASDNYPERPITVVVPFVAGGAFDVVARLTADKMDTHCYFQVRAPFRLHQLSTPI